MMKVNGKDWNKDMGERYGGCFARCKMARPNGRGNCVGANNMSNGDMSNCTEQIEYSDMCYENTCRSDCASRHSNGRTTAYCISSFQCFCLYTC